MKKIISIMLLCALLTTAIALCYSCNSSSNTDDDVSQSQTTATVDENESKTEKVERPALELPSIDLNGSDFVVMTNDYPIPVWVQRDIYAESETGDIINDAVYTRNKIIEDRYNCKILEKKVGYLDIPTEIRKLVNAGDSSVDAATIRPRDISVLAPENMLIEFSNLPYIDLTNPWWDQQCIEMTSIAGKLFAVPSDMTIRDNDSLTALVFNKKLQSDYQIENLYQLVKDHEWTFDKFADIIKGISKDMDGNNIRDEKDLYGLLYQRDSMTSFLNGCGEFIARKDNDDLPVLTLNAPKTIEVVNKLYDVLYDDTTCFHVMKFFDGTNTDFTEGMNKIFQEDRALFMWIRMADVENLRSMDTDFGILPIPKYSKEQENYLHTANPYVGAAVCVPQSSANIENASVILEAMAYESRYILQPAYYDICLNVKNTRDDESSEMLDIIFQTRAYDIGDIFNFGELGRDFIYMSMTYDRNLISAYDKKENIALQSIETLVSNFQKIK